MSYKKSLILALCLCQFIISGQCLWEHDSWVSLELHHALDLKDPDNFSYRGNVTIPSLSSGLFNMVQELLTTTQRQALNQLAAQNKYYRMRAIVNYPNGKKYSLLTSMQACNFALSELNDILWVSVDTYGQITSVSLTTSNTRYTECSSNIEILGDDFVEINTDVLIRHTDSAPTPDTASFIQRMEREREARDRGEGRDNRGFFAKYWMYILPVVLLLFISGATNQESAR